MSDRPTTNPRQVTVLLEPKTQIALGAQADAVGGLTKNTWGAMILTTFAELPAGTALKLLGKAKELRKAPRRVADL